MCRSGVSKEGSKKVDTYRALRIHKQQKIKNKKRRKSETTTFIWSAQPCVRSIALDGEDDEASGNAVIEVGKIFEIFMKVSIHTCIIGLFYGSSISSSSFSSLWLLLDIHWIWSLTIMWLWGEIRITLLSTTHRPFLLMKAHSLPIFQIFIYLSWNINSSFFYFRIHYFYIDHYLHFYHFTSPLLLWWWWSTYAVIEVESNKILHFFFLVFIFFLSNFLYV